MAYTCKNCGYRIEISKTNNCPYCDNNSLEEEKSAEELIDEIGVE